jgi:uncharacterized OsmC-like protein
MQTAAAQTINGVDTTRLAETVKAVKSDSTLARFQFRCRNHWITAAHNTSSIQDFYGVGAEDTTRPAPFLLDADEPSVLLGTDYAANPVEYLLHSLAACLTTSMVYQAAARGIQISSAQCTIEGDIDLRGFLGLDPSVRKGYQGIRVLFDVQSDASADTLAELALFSPVRDSLTNPVPVSLEIRKTIDAKSAA